MTGGDRYEVGHGSARPRLGEKSMHSEGAREPGGQGLSAEGSLVNGRRGPDGREDTVSQELKSSRQSGRCENAR